jgi:hypothetical protein
LEGTAIHREVARHVPRIELREMRRDQVLVSILEQDRADGVEGCPER